MVPKTKCSKCGQHGHQKKNCQGRGYIASMVDTVVTKIYQDRDQAEKDAPDDESEDGVTKSYSHSSEDGPVGRTRRTALMTRRLQSQYSQYSGQSQHPPKKQQPKQRNKKKKNKTPTSRSTSSNWRH